MSSMGWLLEEQKKQFKHDSSYHQDIHCLPRSERLKHYGLHFAKYCGRIARVDENHSFEKTLTDWFLVALSASNTLQDPFRDHAELLQKQDESDELMKFVDATGRFADACEKIDHLEEFRHIAIPANREIIGMLVSIADLKGWSIAELASERRKELSNRAYYS